MLVRGDECRVPNDLCLIEQVPVLQRGPTELRCGMHFMWTQVTPAGVNGDGRTPTYGAGAGVNVDWVSCGRTAWAVGGAPPTQAEVQALRDKCEELADDVRALSTLVHALRGALVEVEVVKGGV